MSLMNPRMRLAKVPMPMMPAAFTTERCSLLGICGEEPGVLESDMDSDSSGTTASSLWNEAFVSQQVALFLAFEQPDVITEDKEAIALLPRQLF